MSIEEKAKAYDEALERAKAYHRNELAGSRKEMTEYIFPELRESEDERIRKQLISIMNFLGRDNAIFSEGQITKEQAIAYLEKQKEQKSIVWTEEDEEIREHLINICNEWIDGGWSARPCGNDIKWLKNLLEGQKQQKSIEDVIKDITKNKESAIKFLKLAGIMDDNGKLAEIYRSEQKPAQIEQSHGGLIYTEVLNEARENKYVRGQLLWELMHNGIISEADHIYLMDDNRKPWTTNEHQKSYKEGFSAAEELQKLTQKPTENNVIIPQFRIGDYIKPKAYNEEHLIKDINKDGYVLDIDFVVPFKHEDVWEVVKPKQEWSKEDKRMLERAIHIIVEYSDIDEKESEIVQNWLKDLLERFNLQIKQEWSEEDKMRLAEAIRMVEANGAWIIPRNEVKPISDLLKSLCLQPHWKPSEEQMEALETAERWYSDNMGCNLVLVSLCEQLKKLM